MEENLNSEIMILGTHLLKKSRC